jgi:hypothetical protein
MIPHCIALSDTMHFQIYSAHDIPVNVNFISVVPKHLHGANFSSLIRTHYVVIFYWIVVTKRGRTLKFSEICYLHDD